VLATATYDVQWHSEFRFNLYLLRRNYVVTSLQGLRGVVLRVFIFVSRLRLIETSRRNVEQLHESFSKD